MGAGPPCNSNEAFDLALTTPTLFINPEEAKLAVTSVLLLLLLPAKNHIVLSVPLFNWIPGYDPPVLDKIEPLLKSIEELLVGIDILADAVILPVNPEFPVWLNGPI